MSVDKSSEPEIEIFDEEQSRETIIDFVQTHPGCIVQKIVDQTKIGARRKVFRILGDLKKEKIIIEEELKTKRRVRDKLLFVNGANPYTVVLNELKKFEKIYFSILDKAVVVCKNKLNPTQRQATSPDDDLSNLSDAMNLSIQPPHIFYGFLNIYMLRLVTNWSKEIRNKDVLDKVNSMIFAKFALMQSHTNKIMASISFGSIRISYMREQMTSINQLQEKLKNLKEYDMEKEVNQLSKLIDSVFINEETRSYFRHKKGRLYRWDLKYKKEDIKELAEDMYRHRDWFDDAYSS
jgi:hypothetical protein